MSKLHPIFLFITVIPTVTITIITIVRKCNLANTHLSVPSIDAMKKKTQTLQCSPHLPALHSARCFTAPSPQPLTVLHSLLSALLSAQSVFDLLSTTGTDKGNAETPLKIEHI